MRVFILFCVCFSWFSVLGGPEGLFWEGKNSVKSGASRLAKAVRSWGNSHAFDSVCGVVHKVKNAAVDGEERVINWWNTSRLDKVTDVFLLGMFVNAGVVAALCVPFVYAGVRALPPSSNGYNVEDLAVRAYKSYPVVAPIIVDEWFLVLKDCIKFAASAVQDTPRLNQYGHAIFNFLQED